MEYNYNYYYYHSSIPYEPKVGKAVSPESKTKLRSLNPKPYTLKL